MNIIIEGIFWTTYFMSFFSSFVMICLKNRPLYQGGIMMNSVKTDPVLKDYFDDWYHFSDFINGALFDGKPVLSYDDLLSYDRETTTIVDFGYDVKSIVGIRDVIVKTSQKGMFVLIALENQSSIDHLMALREFIYTAAEYNRQLRKYESEYRKTLNEEKKAAHQKGEERGRKEREPLKLMPVMTPVFYYGEGEWEDTVNLWDKVEIPEEYKELINDWKIRIYDIKKLKVENFKNEDNRKFIETVQAIHRSKKGYESLKGIKLKRNVALAVAAVTDRKYFKEYLEEKEEEEVDMYEAMRRFYNQSIETGKKEGIEIGRNVGLLEGSVRTIIKVLNTKLGPMPNEIIQKIKDSSQEKIEELTVKILTIENKEELENFLNH